MDRMWVSCHDGRQILLDAGADVRFVDERQPEVIAFLEKEMGEDS